MQPSLAPRVQQTLPSSQSRHPRAQPQSIQSNSSPPCLPSLAPIPQRSSRRCYRTSSRSRTQIAERAASPSLADHALGLPRRRPYRHVYDAVRRCSQPETLAAARVETPSQTSSQTYQNPQGTLAIPRRQIHLQKINAFYLSTFPRLCLSRACLDKLIPVFIEAWLQKGQVWFHTVPSHSMGEITTH